MPKICFISGTSKAIVVMVDKRIKVLIICKPITCALDGALLGKIISRSITRDIRHYGRKHGEKKKEESFKISVWAAMSCQRIIKLALDVTATKRQSTTTWTASERHVNQLLAKLRHISSNNKFLTTVSETDLAFSFHEMSNFKNFDDPVIFHFKKIIWKNPALNYVSSRVYPKWYTILDTLVDCVKRHMIDHTTRNLIYSCRDR